jgi:8-oxo-dGTP pyrophosphatase MutT (NUDIX family)
VPEDHAHHHPAPLIDQQEPPRPKTVRARHAASLIVLRGGGDNPQMLMGLRGAGHRFMPNRLVFPGGAVDRADLSAPCATPLSPRTEWALRKSANPYLVHGLGIAAARELHEETGLTLGSPPHLGGLAYLMRAVTPLPQPIRFNARFFVVTEDQVSGEVGGDGELENLTFYGVREALQMDLATPTRRVVDQLRTWLAMSEDDRAAMTHVPVLRARAPRQWME